MNAEEKLAQEPKSYEEYLERLSELPEYLEHKNIRVREEAMKLLKRCSGSPEYLEYLRKVDILGSVVRALKDTGMVPVLAQASLVNITTDSVLRERLLDEGAVDVVMELLVEAAKKGRPARMLLMTLINITLSNTGISAVMQDGKPYYGLHATRILTWLCNESFYKKDQQRGLDDWGKTAGVVANLSQHEGFRKLFIESNQKANTPRDFLQNIQWQLRLLQQKPADKYLLERALGIYKMFHNVVLDNDKHWYFLSPQFGLFGLMLQPILAYNDGAINAKALEQMPTELRLLLQLEYLYYNPANELRKLVLDMILSFCRNKPARKWLRASNLYYIVRELHKYEREVENDEIDEMIEEDIIHYFLLDEDEAEGVWVEEQKQAMEQLQRQSEGLSLELEDENKLDVDQQAAQNVADDDKMARLEPTEDGQIMCAEKYNQEREKLHKKEEERLEKAMKERELLMAQAANTLNTDFLDFL